MSVTGSAAICSFETMSTDPVWAVGTSGVRLVDTTISPSATASGANAKSCWAVTSIWMVTFSRRSVAKPMISATRV